MLRDVKDELSLNQSTDDIRSNLDVSQDPASNLVVVSATAPTAEESATLANATAETVADITNRETRKRYHKLADKLRDQSARLGDRLPENFDQLSRAEQGSFQNILRQQQVLGEQAARLDALSTVSEIAEVTEKASPPKTPASPKLLESTLLGAVFGLLIGLVAARIAESLDRKLRSSDEAQALVPYPLVGGVVAGAIGNVPVGGDPEEDSAQLDSFRMLRNNVRFLGGKEPPKSILVTSPLPEEGKTTVAVGLAVAAAASGLTTLLFEADLHRPVHAERLGLRPEPGLAEFLRDELPPEEVLQVFEFADPALQRSAGHGAEPTESALACFTAGHLGVLSAEVLGSGQFSELVQTVVGAYDLVIVGSRSVARRPRDAADRAARRRSRALRSTRSDNRRATDERSRGVGASPGEAHYAGGHGPVPRR